MNDKQAKWQEIANRGLQDKFDPETRARFDEAVNRGLITLPVTQEMSQANNTDSPTKDRGVLGSALGGVSGAATIASDFVGAGVGGLTMLVDTMNPFTDNDPIQLRDAVKSKFSIPPNEGGEAALKQLDSAIEPIKPVLKWIEDFKQRANDYTLDKTNSPTLAALVYMLPDIALEMTAINRMIKTPKAGQFKLDPSPAESEIRTAKIAEKASSKTGVDLFRAQKTLNPTNLEQQSFVAQLPAGAVRAREKLGIQNTQALSAVDDVLNSFASPKSVGSASVKFRSAAQKAVDSVKKLRSEVSSPIYKQAFRRQSRGKSTLINTKNLQIKIEEMSKQFDQNGQIAKNLNIAAKKIKNANGDLRKLHSAKIELDQTINAFGQDSVGNTTKRYLTGVVKDLTDNLTAQSPSYRAAKSEFTRLSPEVDKIKNSQIGKISNLDDTQLKSISKRIFDPAETNPEIIKSARVAITKADPEAWNAITRAELERRMGRIRADISSPSNISSVENVPSQLFNSIFGNKKSRDILYSSVDGATKENLKYLETILKRASTGRPGGSQTGVRSEISKELRGGAFQSIRDFVKSPTGQIAAVGEEAAFNSRVKAMSEIMFDPTWRSEMQNLRSLNPSSSAAKDALDKILTSVLIASPYANNTANKKDKDNK